MQIEPIMNILLTRKNNELYFRMILTDSDHREADGQRFKVTLVSDHFRFILPVDTDMHPDLLASAILSVVLPFAGRQIQLPFAISTRLHEEIARGFDKEVGPVSASLNPRRPGSHPGVSYSGGVDSTAAAHLMPGKIARVFYERIPHPNISYPKNFDTYQTSAALRLFAEMERHGDKVYTVKSDHEYLITPHPDWCTWIGAASPVMLLADYLDLDTVVFGSDLSSVFMPVWKGFRYMSWNFENPYEDPYQTWMTGIGLPISRPVGGISGIGNQRIVMDLPYHQHLTFCANGPGGGPCMSCPKCLRKAMTVAAVQGIDLPEDTWYEFSRLEEVRKLFTSGAIVYAQHYFQYLFNHLPPVQNRYFRRVQEGMARISDNVAFLNKWNPETLTMIAPQYREDYLQKKNHYFEDYSEEDIRSVKSWPQGVFVMDDADWKERAADLTSRIKRSVKRRAARLSDNLSPAR